MDEELFSQKNHEVHILQNQIKTLLQEKKELQEFLKEAQETQRLQVFFHQCMYLSVLNHPSNM